MPSAVGFASSGNLAQTDNSNIRAYGQKAMPPNGNNTPGSAQLSARANKKKKRAAKAAMKPGAPAAKVTRGFDTPSSVTSAGEDSDLSSLPSPPKGLGISGTPSAGSSPLLKASALTRAISDLKLHDDPAEARGRRPGTPQKGALESQAYTSPLAKAMSSDGDDVSDKEVSPGSYEVKLESDFASAENKSKRIFGGAIEGGLRTDSPHRKMTASDFEPLKCLGKGTYGTVILVKQHSTGRLFAQKQLKKASLTVHKHLVEQTRSERQILESVNRHPFVVKLFYAFQDQQKLYLILEYAQGGELFQHLRVERMFSEEVAAFYMAEMVLALDHLHRHLGVVYRDLKPENCLLDSEGHLLLTDFGLSKVAVTDDATDGKCHTMQIGTIDYMAPEVVQGKPYDAAVDWWSLGALGYDLMTGSPPFASANTAKTQQRIVHGGKIAMPYYLSPDAKDLLLRLLRREPRKRLGADMPRDLATIKKHRFFRRVDWPALSRRDESIVPPIQPIITDPEAAENFADEFTGLALSVGGVPNGAVDTVEPVDISANGDGVLGEAAMELGDNPFGGFTFVASSSLLETAMEIDA